VGVDIDGENDMKSRRFMQVDVFTAVPFLGNPVAVVLDAEGLDTAAMPAIARWTNLSETTFVTPPIEAGADYAVRIFTPAYELPFAGHPTLGTACAVLTAGLATPRDGRIVQQCAAGLVEVAVSADGAAGPLSFRLPRREILPLTDGEALVAAMAAQSLGTPVIADTGPRWMTAELANGAAVRALNPDAVALIAVERAEGANGLTVFGVEDGGIAVRSFFSVGDALVEDPVCGSGNGAVAVVRLASGAIGPGDAYAASQGREIGRDGRIAVRIDADGGVHVGGHCVVCVTGEVLG
jgi:PhzF family phenazine biosynthesis protein